MPKVITVQYRRVLPVWFEPGLWLATTISMIGVLACFSQWESRAGALIRHEASRPGYYVLVYEGFLAMAIWTPGTALKVLVMIGAVAYVSLVLYGKVSYSYKANARVAMLSGLTWSCLIHLIEIWVLQDLEYPSEETLMAVVLPYLGIMIIQVFVSSYQIMTNEGFERKALGTKAGLLRCVAILSIPSLACSLAVAVLASNPIIAVVCVTAGLVLSIAAFWTGIKSTQQPVCFADEVVRI